LEEREISSDEITYSTIAKLYPNMTLKEVLKAEEVFASADLDGDGTIDVQGG